MHFSFLFVYIDLIFFSPLFYFFQEWFGFGLFEGEKTVGLKTNIWNTFYFPFFFFCCVGMLFLGLLGVITHSAGSVWFSIQFWLSKRQGCLVFPFTPFTIYENDYYSLIHSIPPQKQLDTENTWMFLYFLREKKINLFFYPCIGYLKNRKLFIDLCCRRIIFY